MVGEAELEDFWEGYSVVEAWAVELCVAWVAFLVLVVAVVAGDDGAVEAEAEMKELLLRRQQQPPELLPMKAGRSSSSTALVRLDRRPLGLWRIRLYPDSSKTQRPLAP